MARIFITGSSDGLGRRAAELMASEGHQVVLHARNEQRATDARSKVPNAEAVVIGDLTNIADMRSLANQVNDCGDFDAIIHNAAVGYREKRLETADGLPHLFAINSLAPYVLTALIQKPSRLIYMSSGMHQGVDPSLDDLTWKQRPWSGSRAYAESKLHNIILAFAIARRWPDVFCNAVDPGWVPTKMGGRGAPDSFEDGSQTQAWLATSDEPGVEVSGQYFHHQKPREPNPAARDRAVQDRFIAECARLSGIDIPR